MTRLLGPFSLVILMAAASTGNAAGPAVGEPAPEFSLPGSDGKTYRLSDLRGKVVVLAWYPKAFTGG